MILAGDIGGTKAQLALFDTGGPARAPAHAARLPTRGSPSLEHVLREFLAGTPLRPTRAVFGVAGPVAGNRCIATNLPWQVDGAVLAAEIGVPVKLLNDLEATAWGIATLAPGDLHTLQAGEPHPGHRVLIAAGTGLGEALMPWDGECWHPMPSEGGHTDFAARNRFEDELLIWLRARHGRVSYERILSGPGIAELYLFLRASRQGVETPEEAARFDAAPDPAAAVSALRGEGCDRARLAIRHFCEVYGAEAGNLALKGLALGGVYIGGGIAPKLLDALGGGEFVRAFGEKGRLSPLMHRLPIHVILDSRCALWGAARFAMGSALPGAATASAPVARTQPEPG